jgi:hypothetical protein
MRLPVYLSLSLYLTDCLPALRCSFFRSLLVFDLTLVAGVVRMGGVVWGYKGVE